MNVPAEKRQRLALVALVATAMAAGCAKDTPKQAIKPPAAKAAAGAKAVPVPQYPAPDDEDDDDEPLDADAQALLGNSWLWLGNLTPTETLKAVRPNRYTLTIKPGGWFELRADCIKGEGVYETRGDRIALSVVQQSHDACGNGSQSEAFLKALEAADRYRFVGDRLRITMKREKKEMVFYRPK